MRWDWVNLWLGRADNDLRAAELILAGSLPSYETVSFHAQQAVEKALKALLIRHQIEFERTHNLAELLRLAEPIARDVATALADCPLLTPYAVEARYPGGPPVEQPDASQHLELARDACRVIREALRSYLETERPHG